MCLVLVIAIVIVIAVTKPWVNGNEDSTVPSPPPSPAADYRRY